VLLAIAILLTVTVLSPPVGIAAMGLAAVVEVGEFFFWRRFLRRYRVRTGAEALIGEAVDVIERCDPTGRVKLRGELWTAHSAQTLEVGETARITGVDGLTLELAPGAGRGTEKGPR
jgi:membrane protein implicated in regulation of membrane protease activity